MVKKQGGSMDFALIILYSFWLYLLVGIFVVGYCIKSTDVFHKAIHASKEFKQWLIKNGWTEETLKASELNQATMKKFWTIPGMAMMWPLLFVMAKAQNTVIRLAIENGILSKSIK